MRTEEEILEWISEQQDYYEKKMDDHKNQTDAFFNQMIGGHDCLSWLFTFLTERDE